MMNTRAVLVAAVLFIPSALAAQRAPYWDVGAGVAMESARFNDRADIGLSQTLATGAQVNDFLAVETRVNGAHFGAPVQFTSPGGCVGSSPCIIPTPADVNMLSLGGAVVIGPRMGDLRAGLRVGAGARHLAHGSFGSETRPYVEIGPDLTVRTGAVAWSANAGLQFAPTSSDLPRWIAPITLGLRF